MVKSNSVYPPQAYIGEITGEYFITQFDGSVECIHKYLEKHGFSFLWDYPLTEIDHIVENDLNVVLVDCSRYEGSKYVSEYRWFEVPEDFEEEEDDDIEEDMEDYTPSSTNGDYSPSNPWDAPGMSTSDFI